MLFLFFLKINLSTGKQLFQWAKENQLENLEIPSKIIEVFSMEIIEMASMSMSGFINHIEERIHGISLPNSGKFRQVEILHKWKEILDKNPKTLELVTVTIHAHVSHGAYIRSIAHQLGQYIGTGAVVIDLLRTCVGNFTLQDAIKL